MNIGPAACGRPFLFVPTIQTAKKIRGIPERKVRDLCRFTKPTRSGCQPLAGETRRNPTFPRMNAKKTKESGETYKSCIYLEKTNKKFVLYTHTKKLYKWNQS